MDWLHSTRGFGTFGGMFLRRSTWLLVAAAALFLAQLLPGVGLILMIFGGGLWTGLLIDLALLFIIPEALAGYLPRAWLFVPAAAVCAYFGLLVSERLELRQLEATWRSGNTADSVAFAPETDNLLLRLSGVSFPDQDEAEALLYSTVLRRVYLGLPQGEVALIERSTQGGCAAGARSLMVKPGRYGLLGQKEAVQFCRTENAPLPNGRLLTGSFKTTQSKHWDGDQTVHVWTIADQDQPLATYTEGSASLAGWLPLIWVGCFMLDNTPGTPCGAAPIVRETIRLPAAPAGQEGRHPVSIMLGLQPSA